MFLASLFRSILAWRRYRATRAALLQLDDHMLKDIGLTRGQIAMAAREHANV